MPDTPRPSGDPRRDAQRVQMQLVHAMRRAQNAHETDIIADAMFHARLLWDGVLRETERYSTEAGATQGPSPEQRQMLSEKLADRKP